jgi:hypothetical protein
MKENTSIRNLDISCNIPKGTKAAEFLSAIEELLAKKTPLESFGIGGNEKFNLGKDITTLFPAIAASQGVSERKKKTKEKKKSYFYQLDQ